MERLLSFVADRERPACRRRQMQRKADSVVGRSSRPAIGLPTATSTAGWRSNTWKPAPKAMRRPCNGLSPTCRAASPAFEVGFLSVIRAAATADKNAGRRYVERGIANQVWYELQVIWLRHARRRQRAARSS